MLVILNKNLHLNLTIILLSSWFTSLLGIFLLQEKVTLAQEQIHKNDILKSHVHLKNEILPKAIVGQQLLEEELIGDVQNFLHFNQFDHHLDTSKAEDRTKIATKANSAPPKNEARTEINTQAKAIAAKTNSELILAKTMELIKEFEGFRAHAYRDTDGTPVIGYGLSKIAGKKVRMGDRISTHQADAALKAEIHALQKQIKSVVKVQISDHQLGALTSFAFNTGFYGLKNSTLLRKLNSGDYHGAANEFLRWNKAHSRGRLVPLPGLTRRRQAEKELFLTVINN